MAAVKAGMPPGSPVIGREAWSTPGIYSGSFACGIRRYRLGAPCLPRASAGASPGEGRSAVDTQNSVVSGGLQVEPQRPRAQGKETAPQPPGPHPRGSARGRAQGKGPQPQPWAFHWLKVVKVGRCVRVRRNLLVLPSSTRRVNAFVGDSAFGEHQSPSRPLASPEPRCAMPARGARGAGNGAAAPPVPGPPQAVGLQVPRHRRESSIRERGLEALHLRASASACGDGRRGVSQKPSGFVASCFDSFKIQSV